VKSEPRDILALAYVSVGSNIEPEAHIESALELLMKQVSVTAVSTFYCTEPVGQPDQDHYINGVFEIRTHVPACDFASLVLRPVERQLGRVRTHDKYAPRTLDLDLILYNDLTRSSPGLRLPHPDIERGFVWGPVLSLLSREGLTHACKQAMLDMLPCQQEPDVIGLAMNEFSQRLKMKLRLE
jgi:2-amino-4-hydroxy-6-hydroxymethyldihydropteridine diphosphokinase